MLAGNVATCKAGPGVVISFVLAAIASAFSALCYAEFAGRVPRAGSAYVYSYICVGEFVAFVIGWNMVLEYVIGAAAVTRGFSSYIRSVVDHVLSDNSLYMMPQMTNTSSSIAIPRLDTINMCRSQDDSVGLVASFDGTSVVLIILITILILFGVKHSTHITLIFTLLNLFVVATVVVSGLSIVDLRYWQLDQDSVPEGFGNGGFLPFGWAGVMAGSSTCFFGFIGFDTIASSAEEAKSPKRNVPISILLSLFISFLAYLAMAIIQTLIWPYYDQNRETILPHVFKYHNMTTTYWIVTIGAIAGLASSQLAGMYPLPRTLYSMSYDKLIYAYLSKVSKRFRLPVRAIVVGSIMVAIPAAWLKTGDLADMVSIGTLAAYSLVSLSVLILRYQFRTETIDDSTQSANHLNFADIFNALDESQIVTDKPSSLELTKRDNSSSLPKTSLPANSNGNLEATTEDNNCVTDKPKSGRPLVPQLSAGFYSWFKTSSDKISPPTNGSNQTTCTPIGLTKLNVNIDKQASSKWQSLLELLIVWKSDPDEPKNRVVTKETCKLSKILITAIVILSIAFDIVFYIQSSRKSSSSSLDDEQTDASLTMLDSMGAFLACTNCILLVMLAASMLMLSRLPTNRDPQGDSFQVPWVPLVPTLSILVNTLLMLNLSLLTWFRFTIWMAVGFFIYFSYGIWKSEGHLLYSLDR